MAEHVLLFVGSYTRPAPYLGSTNGKGIASYSLDLATGSLTFLSVTQGIDNPGYLAIDVTHTHLYATSEVFGWLEGTVSAYAIDRDTGVLTYINKQATLGGVTAHLVVDKTNQSLLVVNYWDGKGVVMFPIRADGGLAPVTSAFEHQGTGPVADRQERSHAHCILPDPANRYAFVADLGIDQLVRYRLDLGNDRLVPDPIGDVALEPGSGPRHFLFHPSGRFVYVIQELSSTISALAYEDGTMRSLQTVPTLPAEFAGHSQCSAIHITPDGKYLYGANRGHDSLVIYAVDAESGRLTYVGHQSTKGRTPRDFEIDPTGTYLLAANQDSDTIVTFRIDPATGKLIDTGIVADVPTPVCLKMFVV